MTSTVSDQVVRTTTLDIVIDELELDLERQAVDLDADLVEVYGADSLGLIQVLARVNKELSIRVPQDEAANLTTVGQLVDRIIRLRDAEGGSR
jgi:acyl carrier protein